MTQLDPSSQEGKRNRHIPDTRKIIHRHIQNKNDEITDDDLKSIRISMELPMFFSLSQKIKQDGQVNPEPGNWH